MNLREVRIFTCSFKTLLTNPPVPYEICVSNPISRLLTFSMIVKSSWKFVSSSTTAAPVKYGNCLGARISVCLLISAIRRDKEAEEDFLFSDEAIYNW